MDAGGLMFYSPSLTDLFRRAARYVHRVLMGARTAIFPSIHDAFDLVLNGSAAQALGAVIPPAVMREASEILP